jgi:hypothetical protein
MYEQPSSELKYTQFNSGFSGATEETPFQMIESPLTPFIPSTPSTPSSPSIPSCEIISHLLPFQIYERPSFVL